MFTMEIPYVPMHETPIVMAQAASGTGSGAQQPDYILKECQETESTGDSESAFNTLSPAGILYNYFNSHGRRIETVTIRTNLLEGTTHGKLNILASGKSYLYVPEPGYIGNDKAIFMAEFEGKRYKIIVNLVVTLTVGESPLGSDELPVCPDAELIKVKNKPTSGSSGELGSGLPS